MRVPLGVRRPFHGRLVVQRRLGVVEPRLYAAVRERVAYDILYVAATAVHEPTTYLHAVLRRVLHVRAAVAVSDIGLTVGHAPEVARRRVEVVGAHLLPLEAVRVDAAVVRYGRGARAVGRYYHGRLPALVRPVAQRHYLVPGPGNGRAGVAVRLGKVYVVLAHGGHQPPVVRLPRRGVERLTPRLVAHGELVGHRPDAVRRLEAAAVGTARVLHRRDLHCSRRHHYHAARALRLLHHELYEHRRLADGQVVELRPAVAVRVDGYRAARAQQARGVPAELRAAQQLQKVVRRVRNIFA